MPASWEEGAAVQGTPGGRREGRRLSKTLQEEGAATQDHMGGVGRLPKARHCRLGAGAGCHERPILKNPRVYLIYLIYLSRFGLNKLNKLNNTRV